MDPKKSNIVKTPVALGCYCYLFAPRPASPTDEPGKALKYGIALLWDKKDLKNGKLKELGDKILEIATLKWGPKAAEQIKVGKVLKGWFRDGDTDRPEDPVYAGKVFLNASSKNKPGVVDRNLQPVMSTDDAYSGCLFRASVGVYPYEVKGNKGVALGLNNLMVVEKGEKLSGAKNAASDFAEFAEEGATGTDDVNPLD